MLLWMICLSLGNLEKAAQGRFLQHDFSYSECLYLTWFNKRVMKGNVDTIKQKWFAIASCWENAEMRRLYHVFQYVTQHFTASLTLEQADTVQKIWLRSPQDAVLVLLIISHDLHQYRKFAQLLRNCCITNFFFNFLISLAVEDHVIWLKATEQKVNEHCGKIVSSTVSNVNILSDSRERFPHKFEESEPCSA